MTPSKFLAPAHLARAFLEFRIFNAIVTWDCESCDSGPTRCVPDGHRFFFCSGSSSYLHGESQPFTARAEPIAWRKEQSLPLSDTLRTIHKINLEVPTVCLCSVSPKRKHVQKLRGVNLLQIGAQGQLRLSPVVTLVRCRARRYAAIMRYWVSSRMLIWRPSRSIIARWR